MDAKAEARAELEAERIAAKAAQELLSPHRSVRTTRRPRDELTRSDIPHRASHRREGRLVVDQRRERREDRSRSSRRSPPRTRAARRSCWSRPARSRPACRILLLDERPSDLATQQAAAAVGQNVLIYRYQDAPATLRHRRRAGAAHRRGPREPDAPLERPASDGASSGSAHPSDRQRERHRRHARDPLRRQRPARGAGRAADRRRRAGPAQRHRMPLHPPARRARRAPDRPRGSTATTCTATSSARSSSTASAPGERPPRSRRHGWPRHPESASSSRAPTSSTTRSAGDDIGTWFDPHPEPVSVPTTGPIRRPAVAHRRRYTGRMTTTATTARERMLLAKDRGAIDRSALATPRSATRCSRIADAIEVRRAEIVAANGEDLERGRASGLSDRPAGPAAPRRAARRAPSPPPCATIAALPDPVGRVLDERTLPNGVELTKVSRPLRRGRARSTKRART